MPGPADPARTVRLFEAYVRHVWPLHRRLVRARLARRCRRCAASERMVALGADGVCRLCAEAAAAGPVAARTPDRRAVDELEAILESAQGAGKGRYDALVLYSGGKDSTYLIRRVRERHPRLRLLAFTIHNGFMSPVALGNIDDLIPRLGVDHLLVRPRREFYVRLFRHCLTHLNAGGGYGTVDFSDGEFLLDSARRIAAEQGIPLILAGYSRYQVENGLGLHQFESPRERELADRSETAGIPLADIFPPDEVAHWWHGSRHPPAAVARLLFPLHAWDLEEEEIKRQVGAWGLLSRRSASPVATNHQLIPLLGVVDVHQLGYSSFEIELCRMIREGKAAVGDWLHVFELLEHTARTGLFVRPMVEDLLAQLGLTSADVGVRFA